MRKLIIFGFGYSASYIANLAAANGWHVVSTSRDKDKRAQKIPGVQLIDFDLAAVSSVIDSCTHVLISTPPKETDPVLKQFGDLFAQHREHIEWLGYLSTTGVYGDHQGAWVDEQTPVTPNSERSKRRVNAENNWLEFGAKNAILTVVFRLAGIYGPGQNVLTQLQNGTARCVIKEGQFFSRIHVEDIANIVWASINHPTPGEIYNVCDDQPAPSHDVLQYGAHLLNMPMPECVSFEQADLSPMAREFYSSNRRVRNDKIKRELQVNLHFPNYQKGLSDLVEKL